MALMFLCRPSFETFIPGDGLHNVGLFVHDDDGGCAEAGLGSNQGVEVHHNVVADAG